MTSAPRASEWVAPSTAGRPPDRLFDFPGLHPGDRFAPSGDAYIAAWWLPYRAPWRATARIEELTGQRLRWSEENRIVGRRFSADVVFERTGDFSARLRIDARLGRLRLPRVEEHYDVVGAERNLVVVREAGRPGDMVGMGRQHGDVVQFHLRLPFGIAIHKSGDLAHRHP